MRVLIVDDVKGWRDYHSSVLRSVYGEVEIDTADSASAGYDKILKNDKTPYDAIITDLQMESDFEPLYAGEWFVERIQEMKNYYKTKIVIISATYNIKMIADKYGVDCIPKSNARTYPDSYKILNFK